MTAHEQGAAHAADGYARATGKTGVVLATSGPGATNLVTGIATAYMDSIPMVAITGNVGTSLIGRDSFQEVYIAGITMPITKHNFVVRKVDELADILRDAFRIAQTGRKGPVLVDIPKDVTGATAEFTPVKPQIPVYKTELDGQELARAAQVIGNARRPVIYFGGGVAASEAGEELYALAKKAEIPATYTMMAAGVLSYGDPLNLGLLGMLFRPCGAEYGKICEERGDPADRYRSQRGQQKRRSGLQPCRRRQADIAGSSAVGQRCEAHGVDDADPGMAGAGLPSQG